MKNPIPNVFKITKNAMLIFWKSAKVFYVDASLSIFTLIIIIYWLFNDDVWLEGAAAILFIYAFACTIRLNNQKEEIDELKFKVKK